MPKIGPYKINGKAVLAPMAGVTDPPFRKICREMGAALTTAEMTSSNPNLRNTLKSQLRLANSNDPEPRIVQIVGTNPVQLADAAEYQVEQGAQIVDINMGCPAKKVCKKAAGSALLKDEQLVQNILEAVVSRVSVPVTLKIRTGWDPSTKNAVSIAKIAEDCGIQSLVVHGRTRACRFKGQVEYDTIAEVVQTVQIPVFANGDIDSGEKANKILQYTQASGVMIGRGAQGRPWIFQEINDLFDKANPTCGLFTGKSLISGHAKVLERLIINHLNEIYGFYNQYQQILDKQSRQRKEKTVGILTSDLSVRIARKHICWYFDQLVQFCSRNQCKSRKQLYGSCVPSTDTNTVSEEEKTKLALIENSKSYFNQLDCQNAQMECIKQFFEDLQTLGETAT